MNGAHAVYEGLIGALALGEATASEREALDAHAATCESCSSGAAAARYVTSELVAGRDGETWRPRIENAVAGRIRDARTRRSALVSGALGWAVAASLVLNVAFASGFTSRVAAAFRESGESQVSVVASRAHVVAPQPLTLRVLAPARLRAASAVTVRGGVHPSRAVVRPRFTVAHRAAATQTEPPREPEIAATQPDVLAGLDVERSGSGARTVAVEPQALPSSER